MTKIITRYFDSPDQAKAVADALLDAGFPTNILSTFATADGLKDILLNANVDAVAAEAYEERVASGGAVVLVKAGYRPLGVAQTARKIMAEMGAVSLGNLTEEVFIQDKPGHIPSVYEDHPLFMTRRRDPDDTNFHMANWPLPLISKRKPYSDSVIPRHGRMADWPIRLTVRFKPRDEFAFPRHARMANIIFPLTIRRKPSDRFLFPRHARMADAILPLTNRRKPYTGSLIPRHQRMANWPFPHLINGKTGTNALMPGAPRMAAFPVPLLSDRKPSDAFAFPRHARMANLFLPLTSGRKPFTGPIFSNKHARMANFPLPLVVKHSESGEDDSRSGFSFSRFFGLPTLSKRESSRSA